MGKGKEEERGKETHAYNTNNAIHHEDPPHDVEYPAAEGACVFGGRVPLAQRLEVAAHLVFERFEAVDLLGD